MIEIAYVFRGYAVGYSHTGRIVYLGRLESMPQAETCVRGLVGAHMVKQARLFRLRAHCQEKTETENKTKDNQ